MAHVLPKKRATTSTMITPVTVTSICMLAVSRPPFSASGEVHDLFFLSFGNRKGLRRFDHTLFDWRTFHDAHALWALFLPFFCPLSSLSPLKRVSVYLNMRALAQTRFFLVPLHPLHLAGGHRKKKKRTRGRRTLPADRQLHSNPPL